MPEELDHRDERAYLAYKQAQDAYTAEAAAAPQQENPGLWRKLAAIGIGAFGGSQYDKGGMQWGQNLGKEILDGPYQRKMNEHLKQLAAKRMGLDVAQEGMGVMGQIFARKQQAALNAQNAADRKTATENALYQKSQYAQGRYEQDLNKSTEGNYKVFSSQDEAIKAQQANPGFKSWELRQDPVEVPGAGRRYYLAEPESDRQGRKALDITATVNMYNQFAPKVGLPLIDNPGRVSKEEATFKLNEAKELYKMKYQADQTNLGYARVAAMAGRGGGDDSKDAAKAEMFKNKETDKINSQFAALKASKENQYQRAIAYALANGKKDEAERLEAQRGTELVEALNNAHLQIANIWGHKKFKQYKLNNGKAEQYMVGEGAEPSTIAAPNPKNADPLGVL